MGLEAHDDGAGRPKDPGIAYWAVPSTWNTFYPALWKKQLVIAWSNQGYAQKTWTLPPGFDGVTAVDLYDASPDAYTKLKTISVVSNAITFDMSPNQELLVVPAGVVPTP